MLQMNIIVYLHFDSFHHDAPVFCGHVQSFLHENNTSHFDNCRGCDLRDVTVLVIVINYNVPRGRSKRD